MSRAYAIARRELLSYFYSPIAYVALVILTGFWPMPKNLGHVIALSAALLIGIQFWYADQGGVFVLWYLPLLLLLMFRPNLTADETRRSLETFAPMLESR